MKFPAYTNLGKIPFIHTSMDLSVHHSVSPSVNLSLSAANPSKIPCNYGEKNAVNYLHDTLVKSPSVSTLYVMPFGAPAHASSIQFRPYIMHYVCHCTHLCIVHTTCLYIVHYFCHCTCPCITHSIHPSLW